MKKDILNLTNEIINNGIEKHILHRITEDLSYDGRLITLDNKAVINFGSYSYLGLETDSRLQEGAIEAVRNYGIQYPSSRSYTSCALYQEMESLMREIFKSNVILATSTTLGHQAVIPVTMLDGDAVIMDQQVHASVQFSVLHTQHSGVKVHIVRHNNLVELEKKITELISKHNNVWYACDGVYSMYGDCAPLPELVELLDKYPQFHLYVDDAHGMSWTGPNGAGYVLSKIKLHPRMILATSLNKGYAAGGAAFVIPNEELYKKISNCGGPLIFAGQHQNAALGAGIACAKIHLSHEIYAMQHELANKISYCQKLLEEYKLPVVSSPDTPIFFVGLGLARVGYRLVRYMLDAGFYVNLAIFPAVSENCTGVRFTITRHLRYEDIKEMVNKLAYYFHLTLIEEGRTLLDIKRAFRHVAQFKDTVPTDFFSYPKIEQPFTLQYEKSIQNINKTEWNSLLGSRGVFDWNGMTFLEETFKNNPEPENNWNFHYYIIRNHKQEPVLATVITEGLSKDDVLAPVYVSQKIEELRKDDPYYLCSKTLMMGTLITEGQHLYLNKEDKNWKKAFTMFLDALWALQDETGANSIYLRDFDSDDDEVKEFLLAQGFLKLDMPDVSLWEKPNWSTKEELLNRFEGKSRKHFKEDILKYEKYYDVTIANSMTESELDHYYSLYKNVKDKSFELNCFDLPKKFIAKLFESNGGEIIVLRLKAEDGTVLPEPVSLSMNFRTESGCFCGIVLGLNYDYVRSHNLYKLTLFNAVLRSNATQSPVFFMGLTAANAKKKVGAVAKAQVAYVQVKDKYNVSVIASIANQK